MGESDSRSHTSRKRDRRSISPDSRSSRSSSHHSHHKKEDTDRHRKEDTDRRRRDYSDRHRRDESDRHRSSSSSRHSHHHHKKRHRSPSTDYSSSDSSDSSSSSDDEEYKRRHRKKSKKEKEKKRKKSKSKKKSKKHKKSKLGSVGDQWGKYGIIHEADIFTKENEFQAWLIEVKKVDVETLNNVKRKEMFIGFMEDYNTATMPHEKFYNLEQWEKRDRALRMGEQLPSSGTSGFDFKNDEEKLRMEHRRAANLKAASKVPQLQLTRDQLDELTKVNRERVELDRMRKMGLKTKSNLGVRYE